MHKVLLKNKVIILPGFIVCFNITCITLLLGYSYIINACFIRVYNALINYNNYITYTNAISKL